MAAADQRIPGARWTPFFFLLPFLFFLLLFWVIPLVGGVQMSLHANGLGHAEYVGFAHYKALANDERYVTALRNSFVYTLASIVVIVPLALWLAHLLRATFRRLRTVITFALLLPALTPPSVLAVLFLMVFHGKNGLLNQLFVMPLGLLGLGIILTVVGAIGGLVTGIMLLIANFKKNVGWGVASLLLGIPLLVFAIMHFSEVKKPFLLYIAFIAMVIVGFMLSAAGAISGLEGFDPNSLQQP